VFFACFTRRNDTPLDDIEAAFPPHKQWVADQEAAGRIVVAGPFLTDDLMWDGNGFIVFRVESLEAARQLAAADPMHARRLRTYEIVPWQLNEGSFRIALTYSTGGFTFN
jgi:uncharacterized protein